MILELVRLFYYPIPFHLHMQSLFYFSTEQIWMKNPDYKGQEQFL